MPSPNSSRAPWHDEHPPPTPATMPRRHLRNPRPGRPPIRSGSMPCPGSHLRPAASWRPTWKPTSSPSGQGRNGRTHGQRNRSTAKSPIGWNSRNRRRGERLASWTPTTNLRLARTLQRRSMQALVRLLRTRGSAARSEARRQFEKSGRQNCAALRNGWQCVLTAYALADVGNRFPRAPARKQCIIGGTTALESLAPLTSLPFTASG